MITAGIDVGTEYIKLVILKDGEIISEGTCLSGGFDRGSAAERLRHELLETASLSEADISNTIATGQGKYDARFASGHVTEPVADARAARYLCPSATSVLDAGADQVRLVTLGEGERIREVVLNQKCAGGLGIFLKSMARRLDMTLEEMSGLAISETDYGAVSDGCSVFSELDALGLLNRNVPREDVARAVMGTVVVRLSAILNDKIRPEKHSCVLVGGLHKNTAVVEALRARSGIGFIIPPHAFCAGALGAALIAAE